VACFRPFLEHLVGSDLSPKTIQKHVDNIWALGGEIIRDVNQIPSLRKKPVEKILLDVIDEEGGPLVYGGDQRSSRTLSIPPVGSSADSSRNRLAEAAISPTNFPRRGIRSILA
jgi:hypothetical protein